MRRRKTEIKKTEKQNIWSGEEEMNREGKGGKCIAEGNFLQTEGQTKIEGPIRGPRGPKTTT